MPKDREYSVALSPAQERVLARVAGGMTAAGAAEDLGVSPVTVRAQLREVYQKLGLSPRQGKAEAVAWWRAREQGGDGAVPQRPDPI